MLSVHDAIILAGGFRDQLATEMVPGVGVLTDYTAIDVTRTHFSALPAHTTRRRDTSANSRLPYRPSVSSSDLVQFPDVVLAACGQPVEPPSMALSVLLYAYTVFGFYVVMPFLHLVGVCRLILHNTPNS